mmetsp:Transcript_41388/g.129603  ORF Transcript_41388/g.129603 Transcript_41388/m.129603 type:complete len:292 (-) Transcript_41388:2393-3268(-)
MSRRRRKRNSEMAKSLLFTACMPSCPDTPTPTCAALIMATSFAPSPIARLSTSSSASQTMFTISFFCFGETRQQITASQSSARRSSLSRSSWSLRPRLRLMPSTTRAKVGFRFWNREPSLRKRWVGEGPTPYAYPPVPASSSLQSPPLSSPTLASPPSPMTRIISTSRGASLLLEMRKLRLCLLTGRGERPPRCALSTSLSSLCQSSSFSSMSSACSSRISAKVPGAPATRLSLMVMTSISFFTSWQARPMLMAVSSLSPVKTQILMPAFMSVATVSGTSSCRRSSMAVAP